MERVRLFEERLLLVRRRRELTQTALARTTGLYKSDISKYERGQSIPTLWRLLLLADALQVSTDYLLGRTEDERLA